MLRERKVMPERTYTITFMCNALSTEHPARCTLELMASAPNYFKHE